MSNPERKTAREQLRAMRAQVRSMKIDDTDATLNSLKKEEVDALASELAALDKASDVPAPKAASDAASAFSARMASATTARKAGLSPTVSARSVGAPSVESPPAERKRTSSTTSVGKAVEAGRRASISDDPVKQQKLAAIKARALALRNKVEEFEGVSARANSPGSAGTGLRVSSGSVARSDEDAEIEAALAGVDEAELAKLAQEMDGRHATTSGASAAGLRSTVDSTRKSSTSSLDGLRHVSTQEKSVIKRNSFLATQPRKPSATTLSFDGVNKTEIDKTVKELIYDEPECTRANFNNHTGVTIDVARNILNAAAKSTHLEELQMANCGLTDEEAPLIATLLERSPSITVLNLETNNITGKGVLVILRALASNVFLTELRLVNQRQMPSANVEREIPKLLEKNSSLRKFGYQCRDVSSRNAMERILSRNQELARKLRQAEKKGHM